MSSGLSSPALNQTVCALRFFYGVTLGHGEIPERIPYAGEPRKLPVVLSADEVVRFLEAVPSLKTRAALTTAYAAGLRAAEAVALKVADIDSGRMVIRVEHGKGGKDRTVMLSAQLLGIPANILASRSAAALAVSWPGGGEADRRAGAPCGVSFGLQGGGPRQAGDGAHAEAQLRHPPPGERHRHPPHPGAAGSCQPVEHGALYAGLERPAPAHPLDRLSLEVVPPA